MEKVTGVALGLRLAAAFMVAATFSTHSEATEPAVTLIVIDDDWGGLNPPSPHRSHWVIEPLGSGYVIYGTYSQRRMEQPPDDARAEERDVTNLPAGPVPASSVDAVVSALRAPPQAMIDPALFGSAIDHAGASIDKTVQRLIALNPPAALRQRIVDWGDSVRKGEALAQAITLGVTKDFHTDDFPSVRIEASFADGSRLASRSGSQNLFLLPWRDASDRKTFSADLPKALGAVLPAMSANRDRLIETPSQDELDDYLETGTGEDYARFQVQVVAPQAYAALASHFTISEINPVDISSHQMFATVGLHGGLPNLSLRTKLAIKGTGLANPSSLDGIAAALNTAATAPGLRRAMLSAPDDAFRMEEGIGNPPFGAEAKKQFIAQMSEAHKLPDLVADPRLLDGAEMVKQGFYPTYWVALRDHRAVAWKRYVGGKSTAGRRLCAEVSDPDESARVLGITDDCMGQAYDAAGRAL